MMPYTLIFMAFFNGAGFHPAVIKTWAFPSYAQCQATADAQPKKAGWTVQAFCTPGGSEKLNGK